MPIYMLDTDSVSLALRGQGDVAERILDHRPSDICISSITLAELRYGAEKRKSQKLHALITVFVDSVAVLLFDETASVEFGIVATALAQKGQPIGTFDTLLAAHALSLDLIFVSNNGRHFGRVPNLKIENWI